MGYDDGAFGGQSDDMSYQLHTTHLDDPLDYAMDDYLQAGEPQTSKVVASPFLLAFIMRQSPREFA